MHLCVELRSKGQVAGTIALSVLGSIPRDRVMESLTSHILKSHPIRVGQPTGSEQFAILLKKRMINDLTILKSMIPVSEIAISRLSTGGEEDRARLFSLSELRFIYETIRDMHILALILRNHPPLSFIDEETVEKIRRETRKLLGTILPTLRAEIVTVKKEAKTYASIAKSFKEMEQSTVNLDLYLVSYSGEDIE